MSNIDMENDNFDIALSDNESDNNLSNNNKKVRTISAQELQLIKDDTNNDLRGSNYSFESFLKKFQQKRASQMKKKEEEESNAIDLDSDEDEDDDTNIEVEDTFDNSNTMAMKRRKYKPLSESERERRRINCERMRKIKAMKRKQLQNKRFKNRDDEEEDTYTYKDEGFEDEDVMDFFSKRKEDILKKKKVNYDMPEKKKQAIVKQKYNKNERDTPTTKYKPIALTDKPPSLNTVFPLYSNFD